MMGFGPETMISILGMTLIGVAGLLWLLPVGTCSQCGHCRLEQLTRQHERELEASRTFSAPFCAVCGRHHGPEEDHRS